MKGTLIFVAIVSALLLNISHASSLTVSVTAQRYTMDVGQNSILTATIQGGNGAYTCLWSYESLFNPTSPVYLGNESCIAKFYANSSTFAESPDAISVSVNDIAGDTGTGSTTISLYYRLALSLTASANTINTGGSVSISNSTANGSITTTGLPPYSFTYANVPNNVIESGNQFTFTEPGIYTISETVTDSNNANATATATVNVLPTTTTSTTSTTSSTSSTTSSSSTSSTTTSTTSTTSSTIHPTSSSTSTTTSTTSTTSSTSSTTSSSSTSSTTTIPQISISISSSPNIIDVGGNVMITNLTTGGVPPYYYSYNVPQNSIYKGNNLFTFTEPGTYNISETVTDSLFDTATTNTLVTVIGQQQGGCTGYGSINITVNRTDYQKYRYISYSGSGIELNVYKATMLPVSINMNGAKSCLYVNSTGGDLDILSHGSFDKILAYETGLGSLSVESYGSHNILKTQTQGYQQLSLHGSMNNITTNGSNTTSLYSFGSLNTMNLTSEHNINLISFGSNENVQTNGGNVTETYFGSNDFISAFGGTIYRIVCFGSKDNLTTTGTVVVNNYCGVSKGVDDRTPWHP